MSSSIENVIKTLGFTQYESKTFSALLAIKKGKAEEVSVAGGVPTSKVYNALERLAAQQLVLIEHTKPRTYYVAPRSKLIERLQQMQLERQLDFESSLASLRYAYTESDSQDSIPAKEVACLDTESCLHSFFLPRILDQAADSSFVLKLLLAGEANIAKAIADELASFQGNQMWLVEQAYAQFLRGLISDRIEIRTIERGTDISLILWGVSNVTQVVTRQGYGLDHVLETKRDVQKYEHLETDFMQQWFLAKPLP